MTGQTVSRRGFLASATALVLAVSARGGIARAEEGTATHFVPNAFVRIDPDGIVSIVSPYLEMGQGVFTGVATVVAEEMDADWSKVRVIAAEVSSKEYFNPVSASSGRFVQSTGGSSSLAGVWKVMRHAGATVRLMMLQAAAEKWNVPLGSLGVEQGVVTHGASGRQADFGSLVALASQLPVPHDAPLKSSGDYRLVGRSQPLPRVDVPAKVNGTAIYTQDIKLPDMLVAVIAHPPTWGARVRHVDDSAARNIAGVVAVIPVRGDSEVLGGVAVLAKNTWIARQGRDALKIEWDESQAFRADTENLFEKFHALSQRPGLVAAVRQEPLHNAPAGGKVIEASYEQPYLAHAAMEPMNCLVKLGDGRCDLWNGEQYHTVDQQSVARELGIKPEQVFITQLYAGGSFGRRANPRSDFVREAVRTAVAAKAHGHDVPVKMVWTREDDMRAGQYRPMTVHRLRAMLDGQGKLVSWHQSVVGQVFRPHKPGQTDSSLTEGAADLPYDIPHFKVEQHIVTDVGIPVTWLRSVGHTHTAFACESFIDDVARAAGADPYHFRRAMLAGQARHLRVLDTVASIYGWDKPLAPGGQDEKRGRGIAVWKSFHTYLAEVAEVTVRPDGSFSVDRVVCAVDCGRAVNPDIIRSQIEGGVGFGLSFLRSKVTIADGRVKQGNFNDYPVIRMNRMPQVEVHIVPSEEDPTGVGEPGVPPIAPAVGNAIAAAIGRPIRSLPVGDLNMTAA